MLKKISILLAFVAAVASDCNINGISYKTGETAPEGKIVFQCVEGGREPIGCIADDKTQLKPGDRWNSDYKTKGGFVYQCVDNGNFNMAFNVIECITPDGQEFKEGETINLEGYGQYVCYRKSANEISMKHNKGCVSNGKLVAANVLTTTTDGSLKQQCIVKGATYTMQAYSCVFPDKKEVRVGTYALINKNYYTCDADLVDLGKAVTTPITDTSCGTHEGKDRNIFDTWQMGLVKYQCIYSMSARAAQMIITTCYNEKNEPTSAGSVGKCDKGFYYCDGKTGIYYIEAKWSFCTMPDGTKVELNDIKDINGMRYRCAFAGGKSVVSIQGCIYNGGEKVISTMGGPTKISQGVAYRCSKVNGVYQLIQLSESEYQTAFAVDDGEISGSGGSGSGGVVKTTTTTTTAAPTTEATTTTTTEATTEVATTEAAEVTTPEAEPETEEPAQTTEAAEVTTPEAEPETEEPEQTTEAAEVTTPEAEPETEEPAQTTEAAEVTTQEAEPETEEPEQTTEAAEVTTPEAEPETEEPAQTTEAAEVTTPEAEPETEEPAQTTEAAEVTTQEAEPETEEPAQTTEAAEVTTPEAEPETEEPEHTTEAAEVTTQEAEPETEEPEHTTEAAEVTTQEAEPETEEPEHTTEAAEVTTQEAEPETEEPEQTTEAVEVTTQEAEPETEEPEQTTEAAEVTTQEAEPETEEPAQTTEAAEVTTPEAEPETEEPAQTTEAAEVTTPEAEPETEEPEQTTEAAEVTTPEAEPETEEPEQTTEAAEVTTPEAEPETEEPEQTTEAAEVTTPEAEPETEEPAQTTEAVEVTTPEARNVTDQLPSLLCGDFHPLCTKFAEICNAKPERKHDHSSHSSDEWCDSEELTSSEERCEECQDLMKANLELVKAVCPFTCNTCEQAQNGTIPFAAAAKMNSAFQSLKR